MTVEHPERGSLAGGMWPVEAGSLTLLQMRLGSHADIVRPWQPDDLDTVRVAAAFAAFPRRVPGRGQPGQPVVVAVVLWSCEAGVIEEAVVRGRTGAGYVSGLLGLRVGALLEGAIRALEQRPDLLLVDASGRDHPRRAGLAVHVGYALGLPSVGATDRALVAHYDEPDVRRGDSAALRVGDETVGYAVRTRAGANPVLAHSGWRTSPEVARDVVLALSDGRRRTPEPLRLARTLARRARADDEGRAAGGETSA
jgi:deoxyribonuclease V